MILFAATTSVEQPSPVHNPYTYYRFSASMAIIIVVLIAALFFMGFIFVYICRCSGDEADAKVFSATGTV